jgi:hypothetical protein
MKPEKTSKGLKTLYWLTVLAAVVWLFTVIDNLYGAEEFGTLMRSQQMKFELNTEKHSGLIQREYIHPENETVRTISVFYQDGTEVLVYVGENLWTEKMSENFLMENGEMTELPKKLGNKNPADITAVFRQIEAQPENISLEKFALPIGVYVEKADNGQFAIIRMLGKTIYLAKNSANEPDPKPKPEPKQPKTTC